MRGKKARRLRKEYGVKHVRLIGAAKRESQRIEAAKMKKRAQNAERKVQIEHIDMPLGQSPVIPTDEEIERYGR